MGEKYLIDKDGKEATETKKEVKDYGEETAERITKLYPGASAKTEGNVTRITLRL